MEFLTDTVRENKGAVLLCFIEATLWLVAEAVIRMRQKGWLPA